MAPGESEIKEEKPSGTSVGRTSPPTAKPPIDPNVLLRILQQAVFDLQSAVGPDGVAVYGEVDPLIIFVRRAVVDEKGNFAWSSPQPVAPVAVPDPEP